MTPHFKKSETTITSTGLKNEIHASHLANVQATAFMMECVRALLGHKSIRVTSWYRSPSVNKAVGGVQNSAHALGYAVDFTHSTLSAVEAGKLIAKSWLPFDQLIIERADTLLHISFDPRFRRQILRQFGAAGSPIVGWKI